MTRKNDRKRKQKGKKPCKNNDVQSSVAMSDNTEVEFITTTNNQTVIEETKGEINTKIRDNQKVIEAAIEEINDLNNSEADLLLESASSLNLKNPAEKTTTTKNILILLDAVEKFAKLLREDSEDVFFPCFLHQIVQISSQNDERRKKYYQIMDTLFSSLTDYDNLELDSFRQTLIKYVLVPKNLRRLLIDDTAVVERQIIGEGAFGLVKLAYLHKPNGSRQTVVTKISKYTEFDKVIIKEGRLMANLDHQNIVRILGIYKVTAKIVLEYMELSDLVDALDECYITSGNIIKSLHDVASGMEYLEHEKYVFRDLACRNVFVNAKKVCKIGDFGMCEYVGDSDGIYKDDETINFQQGYNFSPESKASNVFTSKSDVWSMGLLIWEAYFHASELQNPFMPKSFLKKIVLDTFNKNGTLPRPEKCPANIYTYVIKKILIRKPENRPSFRDIKKKFE